MAQYTTITSGDPLWITDNIDTFAYFVFGDVLLLLQEVGSGYEDVEQYTSLGGSTWRVGVRGGYWNIDCTISATGFGAGGVEDTDWGNVEKHKLP